MTNTSPQPNAADPQHQPLFFAFLHVFGIAALAISFPCFEVLGNSAPFFVAHDAGLFDVVLTAGFIGHGIPVLIGAGASALRFLSRRAGVLSISFAIAGLVFLQQWRVGWAGLGLMPGGAAALGASVACLASVLYARSPWFRSIFTMLAVLALAYPLYFLWAVAGAVQARGAVNIDLERVPDERPPVFFLVFDELSTITLLDESKSIDADRYPAFARLARDGYWFRNGTTAATHTANAVASIVSGLRPDHQLNRPTHAAYPINVCTVLHSTGYAVHARESVTKFCPEPINRLGRPPASAEERWRAMLRDLRVISVHVLLPPDWADARAPMGDQWRDFGMTPEKEPHHRVASFEDFIEEIDAEPATLYFNHFMLPHVPYEFLADGEPYEPAVLNYARA